MQQLSIVKAISNSSQMFSIGPAQVNSSSKETSTWSVTLQPSTWRDYGIARLAIGIIESVASQFFEKRVDLLETEVRIKCFRETISFFQTLFGSQRVIRVIKQMGIDHYAQTGELLKRGEMPTFLYHMELFTKEDMQELLDELHSDKKTVRFISDAQRNSLRKEFDHCLSVESCSNEQLKTLERLLLPFTSESEEFWEDIQQKKQCVPLSRFDLLEAAAWVRYSMRTGQLSEDDWEVAFAKRFAAIPLPHHLVVPHPQGYLYLSNSVQGRALKYFFRPLGKTNTQPIVLYGTTTDTAKKEKLFSFFSSFYEDARTEIGTRGIVETYEETRKILQDTRKGFVTTPQDRVRLIGHSLGAAQAMRDAVLFYRQVSQVTGVCCPGVDKKTAELFKKAITAARLSPSLKYVVENGDIIHLSGERLLGDECPLSVSVRILSPIDTPVQQFPRLHWTIQNILRAVSYVKQNSRAHMRLLILEPHKEHVLEGQEKNDFLHHAPNSVDPGWESARSKIGSFLLAKGEGFAEFAETKLAPNTL